MTDGRVSPLIIPFQNNETNNAVADDKSYATVTKKRKAKIRHVCQICNKEFTKKYVLTNHLLIHSGVKPFLCEICNKSFTKKCTLKVHLLTHSSERSHACDVCNKSFARKTDFQKHKLVHTGEKHYVCDVCPQKFNHQNNLRRHKFQHLPKEAEVADLMVKNEDMESSLLVNKFDRFQKSSSKVLEDTVNEENVSEARQQALVNKDDQDLLEPLDDLSKQINSDLSSMPNVSVSVNNIDTKFINKNETEISLEPMDYEYFTKPERVTDKERQTCVSDSNGLTNAISIVNLLVDNVDVNNLDNLREPEQGEEIKIMHDLLPMEVNSNINHEVSTSEIANVAPETTIYELRDNFFQPAEVRPYVCEICNKSFARKFTLSSHLLTHSPARPHACATCGKSFTRKTDLKRHRFVHIGKRLYTCEVCNSKFIHQNNLEKHKLNHLEEVKGEKQDVQNLALMNENAQIVTNISNVLNDTVNVKNISEVLKQTLIKKADQNPLQPIINAPSSINTVFVIVANNCSDVSKDKILINNVEHNDEISVKPLNYRNYQEPIYNVTDREKQTFGNDSNALTNINSFEGLRFTIKKDGQDPLNPLIDISKQINNDLLIMPNESVNASKINKVMIDEKQHDEANQMEISIKPLNDKNGTESDFNMTDREEKIFETDLANINSVINFMVDNVDVSNLDNLIESAEIKKEREIKDIYDSLPMSVDDDHKMLPCTSDIGNEILRMNIGKSTANAEPSPSQISIEKQIFNELENLKRAQESKKNYYKNNLVLSESEDLEKAVEKKDLCQSLSVYNDLEQALAFVSDVIKGSENDVQLPLPIEASQDTTGQCEIPKNITDFQLQTIPPDVTEDTMNDVQLLINDDVQHNSSDLKILGGVKGNQDLNSLPDVTNESVPDVQLLSLMNDNIQSIDSEPHVIVHIDENGQISHSFDTDEIFVEVLPQANIDVSKIGISDEASLTLPVLDYHKKEYNDDNRQTCIKKDAFNSKEPYTCDICCEPFEEQKDFLLHVSSHISEDQKTCYLCDLDLDSNTLLRKHILTHYEDDDDISLDEDFSKIGPLTASDIFLGDIDKIDLDDGDFEQRVAKMYALAHVDSSMDGYDSDDDTTRLYSYSQIDVTKEDSNIIDKPSNKVSKDCLKSTTIAPNLNFSMLGTSSDMKVVQDRNVNLQNLCSSKLDIMNQISNTNAQRSKEISKLNSAENCNLTLTYTTESSADNTTANSTEVKDLKNDPFADKNLVFETALNNNLSSDSKHERAKRIVFNIINKVVAFLKENISDDDISHVLTSSSIQSSPFRTKSSGCDITLNENSFNNTQTSSFHPKPADADNINKNSGSNISPSIAFQSNPDEFDINAYKNYDNYIDPISLEAELVDSNININENSSNSTMMFEVVKRKKPPFVCSFCDKTFTRKAYLHEHYLKHAGIKQFACEVCDKKFTKKCALSIHFLTHTQERKYKCTECSKTFSRKIDFQTHTMIHTGLKPYACDICQKAFNHQNNLRRHKRLHVNNKPFLCYICNTGFSERISLLSHVKVHIKEAEMNSDVLLSENIRNCLNSMKEKMYECSECKSLFARRDRLMKHKLTHTVKNPHQCEICGRGFQKKEQLKQHVANHIRNEFQDIHVVDENLGEIELASLEPTVRPTRKTHTCDQCFKVYSKSSALKCHYLTHTGERPHKCNLCNNAFAQRTNLKRHLLSHAGIKPFKCNICHRNFARKPYLRKHYMSHTSDELYTLFGNLPDE